MGVQKWAVILGSLGFQVWSWVDRGTQCKILNYFSWFGCELYFISLPVKVSLHRRKMKEKANIFFHVCCRPRTKYEGRSCFHFVRSPGRRSTPVSGSRSLPRFWSQVFSGEGQRNGIPQSRVPFPFPASGLRSFPGRGRGYPIQVRVAPPRTHFGQNMLQTVCISRPCRRTFFLQIDWSLIFLTSASNFSWGE